MEHGNPGQHATNTFFYAADDVELYDETAPLTDPAYEAIHDALASEFTAWYESSQSLCNQKCLVVNAGCGTGAEALRILDVGPRFRIVAVDISEAMLGEFRRKLRMKYGSEEVWRQCVFVQSDLREKEWLQEALAEAESLEWGNQPDAVVSVYTLHHFEASKKKAIYQGIYNCIRPGGVFVNADLMTFDVKWLADNAQLLIEQCIDRSFSGNIHTSRGAVDVSQAAYLKEQWLKHVREDNTPLPALSSSRNRTVPSEEDILREVGFQVVECTFRFGQSAILWAIKGEAE